jgi:sigma-B regulation protein RsbU (phosphoserine phosphatase)
MSTGHSAVLAKEDIISKLSRIAIFSDIEPKHLDEIAAKLRVVTVAAGETVFSEGGPGDSMNVIVQGLISIHKGDRVLKRLGPWEIFGEMALVDSSPRVAAASAVEETTLLRLDKESFFALLRDHFELAIGMLRTLSRRLNENNIAIENLRDFVEKRLLPLGAALSSEKRFDRLLERILSEAKTLCHADAGTIYVLNDGRLEFTLMFCDSLGIANSASTGPMSRVPALALYDHDGQPNRSYVATRVAIDGRSINVPDVYRAENFNFSGTRAFDQQTGYHTHSLLTVPLKNHNDQVIGVLQLINAQDERGQVVPFGSYEQLVVESLSSLAAVALNTHLLLDRQRELMIVERDVQVGRQIQADFLPETLPTPPGWEIDTRFRPAKEVSGDFFDAFLTGDDRVGLIVADVCDKGVGAALFMALSRSLLRAFGWLSEGCPLTSGGPGTRLGFPLAADLTAEPVRLTNEYIARFHAKTNTFVTLFFGVLDPSSGLLRYINAGHNPPLLVDKQGTVKARLAPTGPALGIIPGSDFQVGEQIMEPGDFLLAFTDGVTEARDPKGGFFTDQRLVALVEEEPPVSASGLLDRIDTALKQHESGCGLSDDITMLVVRRTPAQAQPGPSPVKVAVQPLSI